jgi:hypothetical protein
VLFYCVARYPEGKHLATKRHCKFIEVSALLNHKMDELLVGTLRQIRLRQTASSSAGSGTAAQRLPSSSNHQQPHFQHQHQQLSTSTNDAAAGEATPLLGLGCLQRAAMVVFGKLFQRSVVRSTSCDDLFKP